MKRTLGMIGIGLLAVFLGRDLYEGESGLYFQDAESYRDGIRVDDQRTGEPTLYVQPQSEMD